MLVFFKKKYYNFLYEKQISDYVQKCPVFNCFNFMEILKICRMGRKLQKVLCTLSEQNLRNVNFWEGQRRRQGHAATHIAMSCCNELNHKNILAFYYYTITC